MAGKHGAMTDERKARIWQLWQQGKPMSLIARDIAKPPATVYSYLLYHGGIKPAVRSRRAGCLSLDERETISRGLASGKSFRHISQELGRSPSTISREIARNGGPARYRACNAEHAFLRRSRRPKPLLLASHDELRKTVATLLATDWSPEQIAGWLKRHSPDGKVMYVSHETIYRSLFIQTRGVLLEALKKHLRTRRKFRHAGAHRVAGRGQIIDALSIRERPAQAQDRAHPGHWEGDLIVGTGNSAIATIVDRHSRFTVLCKVKDKRADSVVQSLIARMRSLPGQLCGSLTWDRGQELAAHKRFTLATGMAVYFFL